MTKETIARYEFDTDAMGLGDFLTAAFGPHGVIEDGEEVVYVEDHHGNPAKNARLVRETLSDGSTVVNLIIDFHFA